MPEKSETLLYKVVCDSTGQALWLTQEELNQLGAYCPLCDVTDWSGTGETRSAKEGIDAR